MKIKNSLVSTWWICRSVDYIIRNSRKILGKFLCWNSSVAEVKGRPLNIFQFSSKIQLLTKLVGLKNKRGLSPMNLVTFVVTQNGEY